MKPRLGAFTLREPIAEGGMGVVWRADHEAKGDPSAGRQVAIKVVHPRLAAVERWTARFRQEVRAVARLDHPAVVWVHDYGEVDEAAADASGGALVPGVPWVAMELGTAGTVADIAPGRWSWPAARALFAAVLDGLAHAHARRVLHRDLKPANILLSGPEDRRPGPKLTDFGIASLLGDDTDATDGMLGTPTYMPPEQIRGEKEEQGPWTDLYALGCVAWELVTGAPPFPSTDRMQVVWAHLGSPVPELAPLFPIPDGTERWLRWLLAKDPRRRPMSAAQAAHALARLADPSVSPSQDNPLLSMLVGAGAPTLWASRPTPGVTVALPGGFSSEVDPTSHVGGDDDTWLGDEPSLEPRAEPADAPIQGPPAFPETWRGQVHVRPSTLSGAGLGLVAIRALPMTGRRALRDALWADLKAANAGEGARFVVLRGPAGVGTSRLASWVCERAEEVGVAVGHFAACGVDADALLPLARRALRIEGMPAPDAAARIDRLVRDAPGAAALTSWLCPDLRRGRVPDAGTRHVALLRALLTLARGRAVVLHLDDVHASLDAFGLIRAAATLDEATPLPFLIVATAQDEAVAEDPHARASLEALSRDPRIRTLPVGPLDPGERNELIEAMLGLDRTLAAQCVTYTGGNPRLAVDLVRGWALDGRLVAGSRGFRLRGGWEGLENVVSDADRRDGWAARVERALVGLSDDASAWLERLALLGGALDASDEADAALGLEIPARDRTALVDRLLDARLAIPEGSAGWSFVHGMVSTAVVDRARAAGRLAGHHAALADALSARTSVPAGRLGRHLVAAGRAAEAADLMLQALNEERFRSGERAALAMADRCEEAFVAAAIPPGDERWPRLLLCRLGILTGLGARPEAAELLDRLDERFRAGRDVGPDGVPVGPWPEKGWTEALYVDLVAARKDQAEVEGDRAGRDRWLAVLESFGARHRHAATQATWARFMLALDIPQRRLWCDRYVALAARDGSAIERLNAAMIQGYTAHGELRCAAAVAHAEVALALAEQQGRLVGRARALMVRAHGRFHLGELDGAEADAREAEALYLSSGFRAYARASLHLARVLLAKGQHAEVTDLVRRLVHVGQGFDHVARLIGLVAERATGRSRDLAARLDEVLAAFAARPDGNAEDAWTLERLADLVDDDPALAAVARDAARRQLALLGHPDGWPPDAVLRGA